MNQRTSLHSLHLEAGAQMVEFGGWDMPVFYTGIIDEHRSVREKAGIFDISHMGVFRIYGSGASKFLNFSLTNDLAGLIPGQAQYTIACLPAGGVVDDLYLYRLDQEDFMLVVNASRKERDLQWLLQCLKEHGFEQSVTIEDRSDEEGAVAIQGPCSRQILAECLKFSKSELDLKSKMTSMTKNHLARFKFEGESVWICCTGYTGEDGFEIVASRELLPRLWKGILSTGEAFGISPIGLGARDTLRMEMGYPLYGHELNESLTPLDAGLGWVVAFSKEDFIGKSKLKAQKNEGLKQRAIAFKLLGKSAPPREGYSLLQPREGGDSETTGMVTSGTMSPSLGIGIGLGRVDPRSSTIGNRIEVAIRNRTVLAEVVRRPIYRKP